jgi:hypothetical protein
MQSSKFLSSSSSGITSKLILLTLTLFLAACSDSDNNNFNDNSGSSTDDNPFQELVDQGATRYLGDFTPMAVEPDAADSSTLTHRFASSGNGPMCLKGTEYSMVTRDEGAEDLVIFLRGGGACWDGFPACNEEVRPGIPKDGILDQDLAGNPVATWNVAYMDYCDGGTHASDIDYPADATYDFPRTHHGLQNLSAGLDATVRTFPAPRRILLTGISGGGFGTIFALPLVRSLYPGVPIELVNDSGVAVGKPNEPEFFEDRLAYWNILDSFLPLSCPDCIGDDGHGTGIHIWSLDQDPDLRLSLMSFTQDTTIAGFFFNVPGPEWEVALKEEMQQAEDAHPNRIRSFIADSAPFFPNDHTFLLDKTQVAVEEITVLAWVTAMLEDSNEWTSRSD